MIMIFFENDYYDLYDYYEAFIPGILNSTTN